jgi:transposase
MHVRFDRLVRIAKYGPGSEKLSDAQLELLELEPGVSSAEVQAESERPPLQPSTKTKRQHPGRQELPATLPRVERILKCTPEQCVCQGCGKETVVIGYEESSQLDVDPAKYFVLSTSARSALANRVRSRVWSRLRCPHGSSRSAWPVIRS